LRRLLANCIVIGIISVTSGTPAGSNAIADDDTKPAALKADEAFQLALKKKDAKAVGELLAPEFTWTDEAGQARKSGRFLMDSATGADSDIEYASLTVREYGQLAIIRGMGSRQGHPDVFFARIWIKRPGAWFLFTHQSTPILASGASSQQAPAAGNAAKDDPNCVNPCRVVPFLPENPVQEEVVKAYQAVETAVTHHDSPTWAYYVADEFVGVGRRYTGKPDTKLERVGQIAGSKGPVTLPRMLSLEVYIFADSALMIADHQPGGERPYRVIRVWVNRNGRWQLFHRQETTIE
jgi:Domain of unknown function (DUF4440)